MLRNALWHPDGTVLLLLCVMVTSWVSGPSAQWAACHLRHDYKRARAETHIGHLPLPPTRSSAHTLSFAPAFSNLFAASKLYS